MSIGIIVICLLLQRLLSLDYYVYQLHWLEVYFRWVVDKVEYVSEGHAVVGLLILIMPLLIVFNLFFSLVYHFLGVVVYALGNFILVWLSIDGRDLSNKAYINVKSADLFVLTYERIFAAMFWFVIFGPAGLILYSAVISLRNFLVVEGHNNLLFYALKFKAILDWVPIRLLGLSYAIVGHFSSVSKLWQNHWQSGLQTDTPLAIECGSAALGVHPSALDNLRPEVIQIINRALVFWILTIGLLASVFWLI